MNKQGQLEVAVYHRSLRRNQIKKKNYCSAKFVCRAKSPAEQKACLFFRKSIVDKHEYCADWMPGAFRSCANKKAREDMLDSFIESVRKELR